MSAGVRDMERDSEGRAWLVATPMDVFGTAAPHARTSLHGSLAGGTADRYKGIALHWDVPDDAFPSATSWRPARLGSVAPMAALGRDPDFQESSRRRMVFVRFCRAPLFWQADSDIVAHSVAHRPDVDGDNPVARDATWSATERGLANAVAAIPPEGAHHPPG